MTRSAPTIRPYTFFTSFSPPKQKRANKPERQKKEPGSLLNCARKLLSVPCKMFHNPEELLHREGEQIWSDGWKRTIGFCRFNQAAECRAGLSRLTVWMDHAQGAEHYPMLQWQIPPWELQLLPPQERNQDRDRILQRRIAT